MKSLADELEKILQVADTLRGIDDHAASIRPAANKWSKKEILGHLIDSATNNHQRFIRMQLAPRLELPGYQQNEWVRLQHYQDNPWSAIVDLWQLYNAHLATVIRHVDPNSLRNKWRAPDGEDVDLEFVMRDYLVHMQHHLDQIIG
jgi:hypothetical protein